MVGPAKPAATLADGPLTGVRVLDLTWVLAGPYCTRMLADLGAEVIKVQSRATGVREEDADDPYYRTWNRNKLGLTLNLSTEEGRALLRRLIARCDVVIENFSARVLENWGIGYEALRVVRPDIVLLSLSGMGHSGPWKDYVSFGPTLQALAGLTALTAEPGGPPAGPGYPYADHVAGSTAALAVVAALHQRDATGPAGQGQHVDVSQLEALAATLGPALLDATVNGHIAEPAGNRAPYGEAAPRGVYPCCGADRWLAIAVPDDETWARLCAVLGDEALGGEPALASLAGRLAGAAMIDGRIATWTRSRTPEAAMAALQAAGIPAGAVQLADDLVERDPQLRHRRFFVDVPAEEGGSVRSDGSPALFSVTSPTFRRAAPRLGADNERVFGGLLGLSGEEIARLEAARVIW
ncbi:MAG: CoA transferase [Dehalococcoidia bacterium]|nr:CoA transferase [Dehalococcoidia bacterium]